MNIDYLTDKISLYTYQVKKDDCLTLPRKIYHTRYFEMNSSQNFHYSEIANEFLSLDIVDLYSVSVMIYRAITALQEITSGQMITSAPDKPIKHINWFKNPLDNPRIKCLIDTVYLFGNEKIVIWCRFSHEISDVVYALESEGYKCVAYYGKLSQSKRQKSIDEFEKNSQIFVCSKSCAGYGLNLQFCHNAIYYNNDYNWGTREQSEDRIHRIGQNQVVNIVDIVANESIDERIQDSLIRKGAICEDFKRHIAEKNLMEWIRAKPREIDDND